MKKSEKETNVRKEAADKENQPQENKVLLILSKICTCIFLFFAVLYIVILGLFWLNSAGVVPPSSPLFGFDFIPSVFLNYLLVPALVFGLLGRQFKFVIAVFCVFLLYFVIAGDHALFYSHKTPKNINYAGRQFCALTLNVAQYDKTPPVIGQAVKSLNPDFIFLQEINVPLEEGIAKTHEAFDGYDIRIGDVCDSVIISKYPLVEFHEIMLPSKQPGYVDNTPDNQANNPNRYFLHAVADVDGTKIHLLCLRLIAGRSPNLNVSPRDVYRWGKYLVEVQNQEAQVMYDYIKKLDGPVIFAGDMNAPPNASSMKIFYKNWIDTALATRFLPLCTFPAGSPQQRLDYVFCNDFFVPLDSQVSPLVISDHRMTLAHILLKNSR